MVGGLILAGLGGGMGLALWTASVSPTAELAAAEEALGRHDAHAARAHLDRLLAQRPHDPQARFLAAQAARRSDACADAERLLTDYEQQFGQTDASRLEWALLGVQQGDFGGEEAGLQAAVIRHHPNTPAIMEALAKGYHVAYRWPEALMTLDWLIKHDPGHLPALLLRGTILDRLRETDAAEDDFRRAVERARESAAAHGVLAGLLNRRGYTREAIYHYELARRSRLADPRALLGLARAFIDAADSATAQRLLDEILSLEPNSPDGLVERGRLAAGRGRAAEAEPFLERAVRAAPWHRDGHRLYLVVLKELGRSEAARQCEARLAELEGEDAAGGRLKLRARDTPGDAAVRWELWLWSVRNGQGEEGLAWLTEILRIDARQGQAHAALADYFDRGGQPRRAALHRAAAVKP